MVAEVRKTQQRFGSGPLGDGVYRVVVPAAGVAERPRGTADPRGVQAAAAGASPAPTSACTPRAGCPASATPPGWPSATGSGGCCWPATRRTSTRRPAGRASTWASRTRSTSAGNWPPRSTAGRRRRCWTPTRPNGIRSPRTCWTTPAPRWSCCPPSRARRPCAGCSPKLMDFDEVNRYLIEKITAIGIRYDFGEGHDLLGRRLRDIDAEAGPPLRSAAPRPRPAARPTGRLTVGGWADRVDHLVDASEELDVPVRPAAPRRPRGLGRRRSAGPARPRCPGGSAPPSS